MFRHGKREGWLQELGPRGPWVVERTIGMRELLQGMDCDGKVAMIEESVRRACQAPGGMSTSSCIGMSARRRALGAAAFQKYFTQA